LAFASDRDGNSEIYVMNTDGSGQTRLTVDDADDYWPSWSPDGKKITFPSDRDGNSEIYVMNTDGSSPTRLTNDDAYDFYPSWSSAGRELDRFEAPTQVSTIQSLVGTWLNVDPGTSGWTRIEITRDGNKLIAHFWGACTPTDCDAGTTSTTYENLPFEMKIDSGFAERIFTFSLAEDTLHVTTLSHYTDDSGRSDSRLDSDFRR
jgi:dipeptidyl aminopeptidase/acylaminoacyl peptidase